MVVHCEWPLDDGCIAERQAALRPGERGSPLASGRQVVRPAFSRRGSPARMGRMPVLAEVPEIRLQANVARLRDALSVRNPAACRTIVDILVADGFEPRGHRRGGDSLVGPPGIAAPGCSGTIPVPVREPAAPAAESGASEFARTPTSEPVPEESLPAEEPSDWSPGVSTAPAGDYADGHPRSLPMPGTAVATKATIPEGAYSADGYVITDNVSEDGVVYPPEPILAKRRPRIWIPGRRWRGATPGWTPRTRRTGTRRTRSWRRRRRGVPWHEASLAECGPDGSDPS